MVQFSDQSKTCRLCHTEVSVNVGLRKVGYHKATVEAFECPKCEQVNIVGPGE